MEVISLNAIKLQGSASTLLKKVEDITVKPTTTSIGGQNSINEANSYHKYDTLELSQDYLEYRTKTESSTVKSDTDQLGSTVEQQVPKMPLNEGAIPEKPVDNIKAASTDTVTGDTKKEDISGSNLGSYTASELKTLVQEGKISTAQYDSEIKSRQVNTEITKELTNIQSNKQKINLQNIQVSKKGSNSIF